MKIDGYLSSPLWEALDDGDRPQQTGFDVMPKSYHDDMYFMRIAGDRREYERLHRTVALEEVYRLYLIEAAAKWEHREQQERDSVSRHERQRYE